MIIDVDGHKEEAYSLIMRRKYANEILQGTKRVEFRAFTDKYCKMFIDYDIVKKNEEMRKTDPEYVGPSICRTDVGLVHFYNYNKSFVLDVAIDEITIGRMVEEDIKFLNDEWQCHDYDNEWQKYVGLPEDKIPMFFALHICEIVNVEGL